MISIKMDKDLNTFFNLPFNYRYGVSEADTQQLQKAQSILDSEMEELKRKSVEEWLEKHKCLTPPPLKISPFDVVLGPNQAKPPAKPTEATKYDEGKIDFSLLSVDALEEIAKVFTFGAKKYDSWNYTEGNGMEWKRVWKSLARHIFSWVRGEDNDPESGLSHLAHAGCCIFMLLHYVKNPDQYNKDDRYRY